MNENSRAAYRRIGDFLEGHNLIIYEALLAKGPQTAWEIAFNTFWGAVERHAFDELHAQQVFRRLSELERDKYIQRLDWVQDSPSGRACSVWWVR